MVFVSTSASRTVLRSDSKKKAPVKPGEMTVKVQASCWVASSSLPRTMRHRTPRRVMRAGGRVSHSPGSPHQEEATNVVTGRRALGPWLGPFSNHPDMPARTSSGGIDALLPNVMYADTRGAMHLGLEVEEHQKLVRALQQAQEETGMLTGSTAALEGAAAAAAAKLAADMMQLRKVQARKMQNVVLETRAAAQRAPAARVVVRRTRQINQPRRFN